MRRSVGVIALVGAGCVMPAAVRPMRTEPGGRLVLAGGYLAGAEDERVCYEGCHPDEVSGISLAADGGYGWLLTPRIGVRAGAYLAGPVAAKTDGLRALAVATGQVTVQGDAGAFALATDVGANVIAPTVGFEVGPLGDGGLAVRAGGYARYAIPFVGPEEPAAADAPEIASWDAGGYLRAGRMLVVYSFYRQERGVVTFGHIEGEIGARAWHVLLVGFEFCLAWPG